VQDLFLFLLSQSFLIIDYEWNMMIRKRTRNPQGAHNQYILRQHVGTLYSLVMFMLRDTLAAGQGVVCVV
jgi:hypothetical protein